MSAVAAGIGVGAAGGLGQGALGAAGISPALAAALSNEGMLGLNVLGSAVTSR